MKFDTSSTCVYWSPSRGLCGKSAKNGLCEGHDGMDCANAKCDARAVRMCGEPYDDSGEVYCEAMLCSDCEHIPQENGKKQFGHIKKVSSEDGAAEMVEVSATAVLRLKTTY